MTKTPSDEHLPKPADLQREARRLARVRHLTLVRDAPATASIERLVVRDDAEPEPRPAA